MGREPDARRRGVAPLPEMSPADQALARLSELAAAGIPADRMVAEIGQLVASWGREADISPAEAQSRIERLWDSLSKDAADLQEQVTDAEGANPPNLPAARRILVALDAACAALAAAHTLF